MNTNWYLSSRIELYLTKGNTSQFAPTNEVFNEQIDSSIARFVDTVLTVDKLISQVRASYFTFLFLIILILLLYSIFTLYFIYFNTIGGV